jgi:hypothetical protein
MAEKQTYQDWLKQEFGELINSLELTDLQKRFVRSRWLDQVLWMEGKATHARNWYYVLRLTAIIGGIIVPALVSLNVQDQGATWARWGVFVISLLVAIAVAVAEFFRYGDRWRHYRRTVETLKAEGWRFFQLAKPYDSDKTHAAAFNRFAAVVEEINQQDIQTFISQIVVERQDSKSEANQ